MQHVRELIRDVPNFPEPGIMFRDITPVLEDAQAFAQVIDALAERYVGHKLTKVCGIESRGFIFASALAYRLGCGLVLVRKPGKLPRPTHSIAYALEYGEGTLHIHTDAVTADDNVVLIDDLIATGGTATAAAKLIQQSGARLHEVAAVVELTALKGRQSINPVPVHALITY
jgi:adenine phosphoribosyltransferase